jgi:lysozyme family protein
MPMPTLTDALRAEYQSLFDTCQIVPAQQPTLNAIADKIMAAQARYEGVAGPLGVPWYVVGVLHSLEAGLRFDRHLHNGDPLTARTVQVPAGRPRTGAPPFTWEQSADDALRLEKYDSWSDWSVPGILFRWESYNGWGYRQFHPDVKSPYLWSFTNHYSRGKYVADGTWSPTAVSKQVGCAAILRRLAERGAMDAPSFARNDKLADALQKSGGALRFQPNSVTPGGVELQQFLNQFPGIFLREDGKLGPRTSDAYKQVFGHYLAGDKRA